MTWNQINMGQFVLLQNALNKKYKRPEHKTFALARIVFGKDIENEPVADLPHYYAELEELLNSAVPDKEPKGEYILDGRKYILHKEIEKMTTAQYIDFTNLAKEAGKHTIETLAVFLIPDGHKYNDGYDIEQVHRDIRDHLNAVEGNAMLFFFIRRSRDCMRRSVSYSLVQIMKTTSVPLKNRMKTCRELLQGWLSLEHSIMP